MSIELSRRGSVLALSLCLAFGGQGRGRADGDEGIGGGGGGKEGGTRGEEKKTKSET